jgi:light-regulated signal transduction histidine kinase (bacteriophytochrome)
MTYLGYIRESAQSMAQLIDGLLSLSRVGRVEVSHSLIDLSVIARTVFARLQRDQPDRLVELTLPATTKAVADARLLEIVLENLIGNAWKFTRKRAQAHIEFGQTTREGHRVWFVRDDGAGFDMAYAEKLFAVFQRLHTVSEFEGIGIGLANVERVVRRHGGRVWAEGKVDCGATFYFTLEEVT